MEQVHLLEDILGCTADQAKKALDECGQDVDRAMNYLLDASSRSPTAPAPSVPSEDQSRALPPPVPKQGMQDDEDPELQKAMAASMADHKPSQDSKAESENEQLMRVLAESVQSETHREANLAESLGSLNQRRTQGGPVALLSNVPVHAVVALALQILYAVPQAREAILSFPLSESITSLDQYWSGKPAHRERSMDGIPSHQQFQVGWIQRVQTLYTMMQHSLRAAVVLGDVMDNVPQEVFLLASRNADLPALLEVFFESLVHAYVDTMPTAIDRITGTSRTETVSLRSQANAKVASLFQSYAAVALPEAPSDGSIPPAGETQPTATITLLHNETDNTVLKALFSKLKADSEMDSLLITQLADVLLLNIQHEYGPSLDAFQIQAEINLSPFLWTTQRGGRIDADPRWEQLQEAQRMKLELIQQKARLDAPNGQPLQKLFQGAQRIRSAGDEFSDLANWLEQVQKEWTEKVASVEAQVQAIHTDMLATQQELVKNHTFSEHDSQATYKLCGVMMATASQCYAYVMESEQWYRVADGKSEQVAFDAIENDHRGMDEGRGVAFLAYAKMCSIPNETALQPVCPQTVQAVCQDNADTDSDQNTMRS
ncbi:hypothetical protein MYAM1_003267 [Malassezia yamatoensis]|uniref:UBA domain-containing protein n=1 Tax=Malassezia yamatoensis TaxID=253288 RepID=A0AAJ5YVF8_9BASI|nr:hypothetical protein MYAM1_003267 [Malassezia yamatoensis]